MYAMLKKLSFPLFFALSFFSVLISAPHIFLVIVFVYFARGFFAAQKRKHRMDGSRLSVLFSFFHFIFLFLFAASLLASVSVSALIAFSVHETFVTAEIIFLCAAVVFFFARAKLRREPFPVSPFAFTGILTFSSFLVLTTLSMQTEGNFKRILAQSEVRPMAIAIGKKSLIYKKFKKFPRIEEGTPTQLVSDRNENYLFVSTHGGEYKQKKHPALYRISLKHPFSIDVLMSSDLRELALDEARGRLFVCDRAEKKVLVVDPVRFAIKKKINITRDMWEKGRRRDMSFFIKNSSSPESVLVDKMNNQLLITLEGGYILSYALDSLSFRKIEILPCLPVHMRESPDGAKIYMGCGPIPPGARNGLFVVDPHSLKVVQRVGRFWFCRGLALGLKEDVLFYVDILHGIIRKLNLADLHVMDEITVEEGLREIEEDPEFPFLYAGNFTKGYFYVIDARSKKIIEKLYVGLQLRNIYITPKSHRIFVATNYGVFEILRDKLPH